KPVKRLSVPEKHSPKKIVSFKPVRKIIEPSSLPAKKDYLPLPEGYPPTLSLLRRMEQEFEGSLRRPRVSVVVVNHDGVDFLWHCLFALKTQTYLPHEIILVDNDSVVTPDWLARMVSDFQEHWPKVGVLASAVKSNKGVEENRKEDQWTLNLLGNPVEGYFEDPQAVFYPEGCSLMYARFLAPEGPFD